MAKVILASQSPRRKEIMENMGIPFESMSADINEDIQEKDPRLMVQTLAQRKSQGIAKSLIDIDDKSIIIGADTMVFHQGSLLGKPIDREDAIRMIELISGDVHEVYTGVYIIIRELGKITKTISFAVDTKVWVNPLTKKQIEDYVDIGEPMDKAGGYGIQGKFGLFIKKIEGDYYNVVGLPIATIYNELLDIGIDLNNLTKN